MWSMVEYTDSSRVGRVQRIGAHYCMYSVHLQKRGTFLVNGGVHGMLMHLHVQYLSWGF
jgi:hypothetical protein